ncbi:hypothetical protein CDV36_000151 [Fusarium kuroshium]|uniref:Uncharacterized protein n=1 Tax=Fusarium kuroshium TaxID=2010991 RepID=A0A3M2SRI8_9HYPO|nr:hypothetical protein CDV36_000151 [Fusarium kuroshium]
MTQDCTLEPEFRFWGSCKCTCPKPDPDIAGIGVISSFMTSSALAIVSTCLYLMIIRSGLDPEDSFNPIDGWARRTFCDPFIGFLTKAECIKSRMDKIESTIFSFVLSLADMQLVTGIAMLSAAIIKLHDENDEIAIYHFSMVTNLAWFSSTVHLLTLLAIRTKAIGSMKRQYRRKWPGQKASLRHRRARAVIGWGGDLIVRIISMLILAALLLYCSYVSGARECTCVWFVLGVYWTIDDRAQFHKSWKEYVDIENENNAKGFGQLVPILLLGMPFLQGLQTYSGRFLIDIQNGPDFELTGRFK